MCDYRYYYYYYYYYCACLRAFDYTYRWIRAVIYFGTVNGFFFLPNKSFSFLPPPNFRDAFVGTRHRLAAVAAFLHSSIRFVVCSTCAGNVFSSFALTASP